MKKLIVILGCILLGCLVSIMILGEDEHTLKNTQKTLFQLEIDRYNKDPQQNN